MRIATRTSVSEHTSELSLMPEGWSRELTPEEFTDLISSIFVGLKQPESAARVGPRDAGGAINPLAKPITLRRSWRDR